MCCISQPYSPAHNLHEHAHAKPLLYKLHSAHVHNKLGNLEQLYTMRQVKTRLTGGMQLTHKHWQSTLTTCPTGDCCFTTGCTHAVPSSISKQYRPHTYTALKPQRLHQAIPRPCIRYHPTNASTKSMYMASTTNKPHGTSYVYHVYEPHCHRKRQHTLICKAACMTFDLTPCTAPMHLGIA